ncbi:MAG: flagellar biosynthesis protein FliQ [Alicyclobacillaceae bacterium]|nr:flagellar biosynthesis protein FliQ [Alicyclobacillaceae bacterium]
MTPDNILQIGQQALKVAFLLSLPFLGFTLAVGLLISIFQAVTQIQEPTLTFLPKLLAVFAVMLLLGPWMLHMMLDYAQGIFGQLAAYVR